MPFYLASRTEPDGQGVMWKNHAFDPSGHNLPSDSLVRPQIYHVRLL